MSIINGKYIGTELELFKFATNWKKYWIKEVEQYIHGDVLEVGAGIGINSKHFLEKCSRINKLTCMEPDKSLANLINDNVESATDEKIVIKNCYLNEIDTDLKFDSILYIDVIEHIENDSLELETAKAYLKKGGYLIVLVPAFNFLFSPFDAAVGHYRRYDKKMLRKALGGNLKEEKMFYLDSLGFFASLANKFVLGQKNPTLKQINTWDGMLVPMSRYFDKAFLNSFGKSLVGVWQKV